MTSSPAPYLLRILRGFLAAHAMQFTSVDRVLSRFEPTTLTLAERVQAVCALRRRKLSHAVVPIRRSAFLRASNSA